MYPLARKFGFLASAILLLGTLAIIFCIAFLIFFWTSDASNTVWHRVIAHHNLDSTTAVLATILQIALALQLGVAASMLASIVLERHTVLLPQAASCLNMRSTFNIWNIPILFVKGSPWKGRRKAGILPSSTTAFNAVFVFILFVSQLAWIILTSDIGLGLVPGLISTVTVLGTASDETPRVFRDSTWTRQPAAYPTFAEYHETAPSYDSDGIDDTGLTLRAFLPYASAAERETLQQFDGNAMVFDARVTCQTPKFSAFSLQSVSSSYSNGIDILVFNGQVTPIYNTSRLFNATEYRGSNVSDPRNVSSTLDAVPFSCFLPQPNSSSLGNGSDWALTLCQLGDGGDPADVSGGLVSEFVKDDFVRDAADAFQAATNRSSHTGVAYLMLNASVLSTSYWAVAHGGALPNDENSNSLTVHGQWVDVPYASNATSSNQQNLVVSATLCYAAFDGAELKVNVHGNKPRREPAPVFDIRPQGPLNFSTVRQQLLLGKNVDHASDLERRGLMQLERRSSWLANYTSTQASTTVSYLRDSANLGGSHGVGNTGNLSVVLWQLPLFASSAPSLTSLSTRSQNATSNASAAATATASPSVSSISPLQAATDLPWARADPAHVSLIQEAFRTGASPAQALQAMLTVLATQAFYNQPMQATSQTPTANTQKSKNEGGNDINDSENIRRETFFEQANIPVRRRGLVVILIASSMHLVTITLVSILFVRQCPESVLGASWQSIAHGARGEAAEVLAFAAIDAADDADVHEACGKVGKDGWRVGVGRGGKEGRVGLWAKGRGGADYWRFLNGDMECPSPLINDSMARKAVTTAVVEPKTSYDTEDTYLSSTTTVVAPSTTIIGTTSLLHAASVSLSHKFSSSWNMLLTSLRLRQRDESQHHAQKSICYSERNPRLISTGSTTLKSRLLNSKFMAFLPIRKISQYLAAEELRQAMEIEKQIASLPRSQQKRRTVWSLYYFGRGQQRQEGAGYYYGDEFTNKSAYDTFRNETEKDGVSTLGRQHERRHEVEEVRELSCDPASMRNSRSARSISSEKEVVPVETEIDSRSGSGSGRFM